jgi:hypothetical protein
MITNEVKRWVLPRLKLVAMMAALLSIFFWYRPAQEPRAGQTAPSSSLEGRGEAFDGSGGGPLLAGSRKRRQSPVILASAEAARRAQLSAEHQAEIARIDAKLDREAHKAMEAALDQWHKRGGFHTGPVPDFNNPVSPLGQEIAALKRQAEAKIAAVLSEEERTRWQRMREVSAGPAPVPVPAEATAVGVVSAHVAN